MLSFRRRSTFDTTAEPSLLGATLAQCDVLSLDVFDTALHRLVHRDRDVFRILEQELVATLGPELEGFAVARYEAEVRSAATLMEDCVPQFDRIYEHLPDVLPGSREHLAHIRELELSVEAQFLKRNPRVHAIYRHAVERGLEVLFLSDMYLPPDHIASVLEREGYDRWAALYVSSDVKASKHEGTLYEKVQRERDLDPSRWLHIGDNPESDVAQAKSHGIRAVGVDPPRSLLTRSHAYAHVEEPACRDADLTPGDLVALGLCASFESQPDEDGERTTGRRIGYRTLGPCQMSFAEWIAERAREHEVDAIVCVARDGWLPKLSLDALASHGRVGVPCHYVQSSRIAMALYHAHGQPIEVPLRELYVDLERFGGPAGSPLRSVAGHLRRLGLDPHDFAPLLKHSPFSTLEQEIATPEQQAGFTRFMLDHERVYREIVEDHHEAYHRYIQSLGLAGARRVGIVDVTTSGRTHRDFERMLTQEVGPSVEVFGFYNYLDRDVLGRYPLGAPLFGQLYDQKEAGLSTSDLDMRLHYEHLLLSSPTNSLVRATLKGGSPQFVYAEGPEREGYERCVRPIHEGALAFIRDYLEATRGLSPMAPSKLFALRALKRFVFQPTPEEANHFRGRVACSIGSPDVVQEMVPAPSVRSLLTPWKLRKTLQNVPWRPGFTATLPTPVREALSAWRSLRGR